MEALLELFSLVEKNTNIMNVSICDVYSFSSLVLILIEVQEMIAFEKM